MRGVSRASLGTARDNLRALERDADLSTLAGELFGMAALIDAEPRLRRSLSDPSRSGEDRAALVDAVLAGRLSGLTLDVVRGLARSHWSTARDLADATELLAVEAAVAAAEQGGRLEALEDELFRAGRVITGSPQLRSALVDRTIPLERKRRLVEALLASKVQAETLLLVDQAVTHPRGRALERVLDEYGTVVAQRRERLVARVSAAVPLTEQQRARLGATLARIYGHAVQLEVEVDPEVVGGIRVVVGEEVVDGTIASRLDDARRRLAG